MEALEFRDFVRNVKRNVRQHLAQLGHSQLPLNSSGFKFGHSVVVILTWSHTHAHTHTHTHLPAKTSSEQQTFSWHTTKNLFSSKESQYYVTFSHLRKTLTNYPAKQIKIHISADVINR